MDGITCVYLSALMHLSKVLQQEKDWLTLKVIELYFLFFTLLLFESLLDPVCLEK